MPGCAAPSRYRAPTWPRPTTRFSGSVRPRSHQSPFPPPSPLSTHIYARMHLEQGACDGDALLFAAAEAQAALAHHGRIAFGEPTDLVVNLCAPRRLYDGRLVGLVQVAVRNIVPDGVVEQHLDPAIAAAPASVTRTQPGTADARTVSCGTTPIARRSDRCVTSRMSWPARQPCVHQCACAGSRAAARTVNEDAARADIVEAKHEAHDGRLAAAGRAHQRVRLARGHLERNASQ
jgi:hypothetical protein